MASYNGRVKVRGLIFILLVSANLVSAELLQRRYFDDDLTYAAFQLQNGTALTPTSAAQLQELLPSIESILSVGFLLWVEQLEQTLRYDILTLVKNLNVAGTSSELVSKLFRHHRSLSAGKTVDDLLTSLESGKLIEDIPLHEFDITKLSMSKSVLRASLLSYGQTRARAHGSHVDSEECDFTDFMDGVIIGDQESITQMGSLLVSGQCMTFDPLQQHLLFFPDWHNALDVIGFLVAVMGTIGAFVAMLQAGRELMQQISKQIMQSFIPIQGWQASNAALALGGIGIALAMVSIGFDINALTKGNLTGLAKATHYTSIALAVIGIILTISGFFVSSGVGAILGAVGFLVAALGFAAIKIMEAINKNKLAKLHVLKLDRMMPLTDAEKEREKKNFKSNRPVDPRLQALIDQTAYNAQLVALQLKSLAEPEMSEFERFIFPAATSAGTLYTDSTANLSGAKKYLNLQRWAPRSALVDRGTNGVSMALNHIICAPESSTPTPTGSMEAWPCTNAIGITEFSGRTNNLTLCTLGDGTDTAFGTTDFTNIFMIEKGTKRFTGGAADDMFLVQSGDLSGTFDGAGGTNILDLRAENISASVHVTIDLHGNQLRFNGDKVVTLSNFQVINGRENLGDRIVGNCGAALINGRGGSSGVRDEIEIPSARGTCAAYDMMIEVNPMTSITNSGYNGAFYYDIKNDTLESNLRLYIEPGVNSSHYLKLEPGLENILNVTYLNNELKMMSTAIGGSSGNVVFTSNIVKLNESDPYYEPTVVLPNEIVIKVDSNEIVNTIFKITNRTDQVRAPNFGQAIFFLETQVGQIVGKQGNDTVFLAENAFSERLYGGLGTNTLILKPEFWNSSLVQLNLDNERLNFFDNIAGVNKEMLVQEFSQILGRPGFSEEFTVGCGDLMIDGLGGQNLANPDRILIITKDCPRSTLVRLNSLTSMQNRALEGNFVYFLPFAESISINIEFRKNLNHTFQLDFSLADILNATVIETTIVNNGLQTQRKISFESVATRTIVAIPLSNTTSTPNGYFDSPTILTKEGVILQANAELGIMAIHNVTANSTADGSTPVKGVNWAENMFIISTTLNSAQILGGDKSDTFIISKGAAGYTQQLLRGGAGSDRIAFKIDDEIGDDDDWIDMSDLDSIEEFVGRNSTGDKLRLNCLTTLADGLDGSGPDAPDIFEIPSNSPSCPYDVLLVVRNFTQIQNRGGSGDFKYYLQSDSGGHLAVDNFDTGNHTVLLPNGQDEIRNVTFSNLTRILTVSLTSSASYTFDILLNSTTSAQQQPTILLTTNPVLFSVQNATKSTNVTASFIVSQDLNNTKGFTFLENMFLLQDGEDQKILGGNLDDTFIITNASLKRAELDGGAGGINTILVSADIPTGHVVKLVSFDADAQNSDTEPNLYFRKISSIVGRNGSTDQITIDCNVTVVDGAGGRPGEDGADLISIPDLPCNFSVAIAIRSNTRISSSAKQGTFFYTISENDPGITEFYIDCNNCSTNLTTHAISVPFSPEIITNVTLEENCRVALHTVPDEIILSYGFYSDPDEDSANSTCLYPKILFPDTFVLDVSPVGVIHGQFKFNGSAAEIPDLIETYLTRSSNMNASIMIVATTDQDDDDQLVQIGRTGFDMLQTSPTHPSHIHGNGGANLYVVNKPANYTTIPDIFIYCDAPPGQNASLEIFDLSQLIHPIRSRANDFYIPDLRVEPSSGNLVLTAVERGIQSARMTLVGNWEWLLEGGVFMLGAMYMKLGQSEEGLVGFEPLPNNYTNETIVLLDILEFEEGSVIEFPDRILPKDAAVLRQGDDMVLTNMFALDEDNRELNFRILYGEVREEDVEKGETFFVLFKSFMETKVTAGKIGGRTTPRGVTVSFSNVELNMDTVTSDYVIEDIEKVREKLEAEIEKDVFAFQCLDEGLFANPKSCAEYYRCVKVPTGFIAVPLPCPGDTIFCASKKNCDVESISCPCVQVGNWAGAGLATDPFRTEL